MGPQAWQQGFTESAVGHGVGRGADAAGAAAEGWGPRSGAAKASWEKRNIKGILEAEQESRRGEEGCVPGRGQGVCGDPEGDRTRARGQDVSVAWAQRAGKAGPDPEALGPHRGV